MVNLKQFLTIFGITVLMSSFAPAHGASGVINFNTTDGANLGVVANDGEGGSSDIAGVQFDIILINDAGIGTGGNVFYDNSGSGYEGITYIDNPGGSAGFDGISISTNDGSEFDFNGFTAAEFGFQTVTLTVQGFKNGSLINFTTVSLGGFAITSYGAASFSDAIFGDVDEIRILGDGGGGVWFGTLDSFVVGVVTVNPATVPNGTVAAAYSQTITASGGTAPYSFAVTAGTLPANLTLAPGGVLSGTPTAGGTFNFTVTATDNSAFPGPFAGSQAYTLVIAPPMISLPATALAGGTLGAPYSAAITPASGGTATYAYAVTAGALPGGLTLNASTGAITGTPSALGTFNFSITATDSSTGTGPYTATQAYAITVIDVPPTAANSSLTVAYDAPATNVPLNITGGAPTSVAIVTPPTNGTAIVSGITITYQPNPGYAGLDSFTYSATNSGGTSAPATVSVTVQDPVITITPSGGFAATVAAPYTQTFTFNGGAQPWSGYQVTNLPAGLSITGTTANTVTVSGTPTAAGSFNLNVSATDSSTGSGPYVVGQAFSLTVSAPTLTLAPPAGTFNPTYGAPYSQTFTADGGAGPYIYTATGTLPTGLVLGTSGTLSGTPTAPGNFVVLITATDTGSSGTGAPFTIGQSYTFDVAAPTIVVDSATLPNPVSGAAYSQTLTASGGVSPYAFTVTAGALPVGITLATDGTLSGTTNEVGTFNFTVTATDNHSQTGSRAYTVTSAPASPLSFGPASLDGGTAGTPYSSALLPLGGVAPYTFQLTAGSLPPGLSLGSNGQLTGTPTSSGTYTFTVTVTDSSVPAASFSIDYTLNLAAAPIVRPVLIPTLSPFGLLLMLGLFVGIATLSLRQNPRAQSRRD